MKQMNTIAVISQKGGSGKSTICIHFSCIAEMNHKNTIILDLDPQGSTMAWSRSRATETPEVLAATPEQLPTLKKQAADLKTHLLLIDTAPHSNKAAAIAAQQADLVLIPCRPSILDINAIQSTLDTLKLTNTRAVVVLNGVPTSGHREQEARDALKGMCEVAPIAIYNRVAYSDALNDGRAVNEYDPRGKAAQEIMALYKWCMK